MIDSDKQALIDNLCTVPTKIIVDNGDSTTTTLTEENYVLNWDYEDFRFVPNEGFIGQFVERVVNGNLKNVDDSFSIVNKEIELQFGITTIDNNVEATNWYSLGHFIVNNPSDDNVKDKTSFKAVDYTKYFEIPFQSFLSYPTTLGCLAYSCCKQSKTELGDFTATLTQDVTINSNKQYFAYDSENGIYNYVSEPIVEDIATYYELSFGFNNANFIIDANQFVNNESCREVMKCVGKTAFSWVRIDWDDKCYIDYTKEETVDEYNEIDNDHYYDLTTNNSTFGELNKIVVGMKDVDGENVTIAQSKNLFDFDDFLNHANAVYTKDNGVYTITNVGNFYGNPYLLNLESGKTYTLSQNYQPQGSTNVRLTILKNGNRYIDSYTTKENETPKTFVADDSVYTIRGDYSTREYPVIYNKPQIEQNSSATNWEPYGQPTIVHELDVWDNPLTNTEEKRTEVIEVGRDLFGLKYQDVELTTTGHPWLKGKEKIKIKDMEDNYIYTYAFDRTISYNGHIKTKIKAPVISNINTQYTYEGDISKRLRNTQIQVDKANGQITALVTETQELNNTVTEIGTTYRQSLNEFQYQITQLNDVVTENNENLQEQIDTLENTVPEKLQNTLVSINVNGIQVSTNLSKISTMMTNDTFSIQDSVGTRLAYFGYDENLGRSVSQMDNLTVTNYFTAGYHRQQKFDIDGENRTGWFYIGGV